MKSGMDAAPALQHGASATGSLNRLGIRSLIIASVSVCIILGSWLFYVRTESQAISTAEQLRYSRVQLQRAEQRLQRLRDAGANPLTHVVGEDIDSVQIRLAEFLRRYPVADDVSVEAFEQSTLPSPLLTAGFTGDGGVFPDVIQILRLDLEATVVHAPALLKLLSELERTVAGWPVDVRACDIVRNPSRRLDARCIMDIYHWQLDG